MITFRPLTKSDLRTLQLWLNTPHVYEWWGAQVGPGSLGGAGESAATEIQVEAKYLPDIDNDGPTHRFIIEHESKPIGLIQWYHLRDFPDYTRALGENATKSAGIDFFIGDPGALGRGLGARTIDDFLTTVVFRMEAVIRVVAGPAEGNARSIRALEKAGFRRIRYATVAGEPEREAVMVRTKDPEAPCS